jgi:hypothetical protein
MRRHVVWLTSRTAYLSTKLKGALIYKDLFQSTVKIYFV